MSSNYSGDNAKNTKVIGIRPIRMATDKKQTNHTEELTEEHNRLQTEKQLKELQLEAERQVEVAKQQANEIIDQARTEMEQQRNEWEKEKAEWIDQAQRSGYEDGLAAGKQEALNQYRQFIDQAKRTIDLAKQDYQNLIMQSEDDILQLGVRAAEKILHVQLEEKSTFIQLVKEVLKEVKEQSQVDVVVHPDDFPTLLHYKEELVMVISGQGQLSIYPDQDVTHGSCIIETPFGKIDASIDSQLVELRNKLFERAQEENREYSRIP